MSLERGEMPTINPDQIGPVESGPPEQIEARADRHEQGDRLSQRIKGWWRGDAHTHSIASSRPDLKYAEGIFNLEEIIAYYESLDLEFACITEHATSPGEPHFEAPDGPVSQSLLAEAARITELNRGQERKTKLLSGVEANVMYDEAGQPRIDISDEVLGQLDLVIASRHAIAHEKDPAQVRESLLMAIDHPQVDVIGHPDRFTHRDGEQPAEYEAEYWAIWPDVLARMAQQGKAFEINMVNQPDARLVRMAAAAGVKFMINYDAHDFHNYTRQLSDLMGAARPAKERWAKGEPESGDEQLLKDYKEEQLTSGPGVFAIKRLTRWIGILESAGVTPDRVINSSRERLVRFLTEERGKHTKNLDQLVTEQPTAESDQAEPVAAEKVEWREGVEEIFPGGFRLTYPGAHGLDVPETWAIKTKTGFLVIDPGGELPVESPLDTMRAVAGAVTWTHKTPKIDSVRDLESEFDRPVEGVLLTHGDADHTNNIESVSSPDTPIYAHPKAWWSVISPEKQFQAGVVNKRKSNVTGRQAGDVASRDASFRGLAAPLLNNPRSSLFNRRARSVKKQAIGERLKPLPKSFAVEGGTLEVVPTPGHAPGEVGFYVPDQKIFIGGDLVSTSKDRTGRIEIFLPDVNVYQAIESLSLLAQMDIEQYYPAHGPPIIGRAAIQDCLGKIRGEIEAVNARVHALHAQFPELDSNALAAKVFQGLEVAGLTTTSRESWVFSALNDQPEIKEGVKG